MATDDSRTRGRDSSVVPTSTRRDSCGETVSAARLPGALPVTRCVAHYRADGTLDEQLTFGLYLLAPPHVALEED